MRENNYREETLLAESPKEVLDILKRYHDEVQNSPILVGIVPVAEHTVALLIMLRLISDRFEDLKASKETIEKAAPYYTKIFELTNSLKKRIKID